MNKTKSEIKELLLYAFADELKEGVKLNHEDCVLLRQELISLRDSDVKKCLPIVLIDLLETHTDNYTDSESSDSVVRLLTPIGLAQNEKSNLEKGLTKSEEDYLFREQTRLFSIFAPEQRAAIAAWLGATRVWVDLFFYRDEIEIAYKYWSTEACL